MSSTDFSDVEYSDFCASEITQARLFPLSPGAIAVIRKFVAVLNTDYLHFQRALYLLVEDWLENKVGTGSPTDPTEAALIREVNKLSGEVSGTMNDQDDIIKSIYQMLVEIKVPGHLKVVCSHRFWIRKSYELCVVVGVKFSDMMPDLIDRHDLSKFCHREVLGYAIMFGEGGQDFRQLEKPDEKEEWTLSLEHHYSHNPHHPEYFCDRDKEGKRVGSRRMIEADPDYGKDFLDESIIDMMASRGERFLAKDPVFNVKKLLEMPERFLFRYHEADREYVKETLQKWSFMVRDFLSKEVNKGRLNKHFDHRDVTYCEVENAA
ncbi:hypothetical protein DPMN_095934 [Dreissena polymorpha]|uniref:Uncharacterized protein n=2 Tax=Dreissena polymorpha TaxID=45954 RepID=A0A9D4R380_DREPO|nr:hypothetical protein DPMN_095934 [Dreissena polymorpha]